VWKLLETLCGVIDVGLTRQGLGRWWARRLGLLLIPTLFSLPTAFPFPHAGFRSEAAQICWLLAGFAGFGGGRTL
jgi:hypothetical protein